MNKKANNLKENPIAAVSVWRESEGSQLKGSVRSIITSGNLFQETVLHFRVNSK